MAYMTLVSTVTFIEAQGEQTQLEQLADAIAADFLISAWLIDSGIKVIDEPQGGKTIVPYLQSGSSPAIAPFCQQCYPLIGDNQSAKFGFAGFSLPLLQGRNTINASAKALTLSDIKPWHRAVLTQGPLTLAAADDLQLSLTPFALPLGERPQLLICNPNTLNAHFCLNDAQVLALSSIEKARLSAPDPRKTRQTQCATVRHLFLPTAG